MKSLILVIAMFAMAWVNSAQGALLHFKSVRHVDSPVDAIGASTLPANPVRRSETVVTSLDGSYQYRHSQGTYTSAFQVWNPWTRRNEVSVSQNTYKNTSVMNSPQIYYAPVVDDPKGPKSAYIAASIPLKPIAKAAAPSAGPFKTK